ncbi:hypothetical protein F5141DRAFT_1093652 [Pisolithus sp. B1]|nr:hypothetical protein F5141DRAFT_1093652 [Pisolithus sp. B1]
MLGETTAAGGGRQVNVHDHIASPRPSVSSELAPELPSPQTTSSATITPPGVPSTLITPPRGRTMARYPESLGRVPLHRRGTSKTYERLEDLLREAGYRETRVFTPETERSARNSLGKQEGRLNSSIRGGVGAVVGFLTGLVSRNSSLCREAATSGEVTTPSTSWQAEGQISSAPSSPSPRVEQLNGLAKASNTSSTTSLPGYSQNLSSESLHITVQRMRINSALGSAEPIHPSAGTARHIVQPHQSSRALPHHSRYQLMQQQRPSLHRQPSKLGQSHVPTVHAHLRHMASAPNIQPLNKRPSSSEISLRSHQRLQATHGRHRGTQRHRRVFGPNDHEVVSNYECKREAKDQPSQPPLPRNWLESVARAILSGAGTTLTPDTASARTVATQKSSSALSEHSSSQRKGPRPTRKPSLLCPEVQGQKAKICEVQVHHAVVLCRSAPTSRTSSPVRTSIIDQHSQIRSNRLDQSRRTSKHPDSWGRRKGKDKKTDIVPSLAKTRVENDEWEIQHRYLGGWGMDTRGNESPSDDDDDDDDDELGLDRLLVPARRQHSVRSLRKHLQPQRNEATSSTVAGGSDRSSLLSSRRRRPDWWNQSWGTSGGGEWTAGDGGEDEEGYRHVFSGNESGTAGGNRRRRGLPGSWAQWRTAS